MALPENYVISNHAFDAGIISIGQIPTIIVDSLFSWDTFGAAILGAIIPSIIAWKTIKVNNEALKEDRVRQTDLATEQLNAQYISSNRQNWINDLRDSISKYVSVSNNIYNLQTLISKEYVKGDSKDLVIYKDMYKDVSVLKSELTFLTMKIELMLNPKEIESQKLLVQMERLRTIINSHKAAKSHTKGIVEPIIKNIAAASHIILKKEWNRVKNRE